MDQYNIISPSTDLNELERDMANWCNLPYKFRRRSNDECLRIYGVSVYDLYKLNKEYILKNQDIISVDKNNLIQESSVEDFRALDNYQELLAKSKKLQESPYIVIIDPDITTLEDLHKKYQEYCLLSDSNKLLSDDYSLSLWGESVFGMYTTIGKSIGYTDDNDNEPDKSNIVLANESVLTKVEDCLNPLINRYKLAKFNNNILEAEKIRYNILSSTSNNAILESLVIDKSNMLKESEFDKDILPKVCPWFTIAEMSDVPINDKISKVDYFYQKLKQELNRGEYDGKSTNLVNYGWNPSVPLSNDSLEYAKDRQAKLYKYIDIINIETINPNDQTITRMSFDPVFFVFDYNEEIDNLTILPNYNKVGILIGEKVYTFTGLDSNFKGFKIESLADYNYIDIATMFIDRLSYNKLLENCDKFSVEEYDGKFNFDSPFVLFNKLRNNANPDCMKVIYSRYVYLLLKILNIDLDDNTYTKDFRINKLFNIFKVWSGKASDFNEEEMNIIIQKLVIVASNVYTKDLVKESVGFADEDIVKKIVAKPCIVYNK